MSAANVELTRTGYAAVARGDIDAIRDFLDPNVKWHGGDPSFPGACQNRDQAVEFMRQARRRGGIGELVDVIDAGEQVVVVVPPAAPEGEEAPLRANVTTFRDGRVVEIVAHETPESALAAAGA